MSSYFLGGSITPRSQGRRDGRGAPGAARWRVRVRRRRRGQRRPRKRWPQSCHRYSAPPNAGGAGGEAGCEADTPVLVVHYDDWWTFGTVTSGLSLTTAVLPVAGVVASVRAHLRRTRSSSPCR